MRGGMKRLSQPFQSHPSSRSPCSHPTHYARTRQDAAPHGLHHCCIQRRLAHVLSSGLKHARGDARPRRPLPLLQHITKVEDA